MTAQISVVDSRDNHPVTGDRHCSGGEQVVAHGGGDIGAVPIKAIIQNKRRSRGRDVHEQAGVVVVVESVAADLSMALANCRILRVTTQGELRIVDSDGLRGFE